MRARWATRQAGRRRGGAPALCASRRVRRVPRAGMRDDGLAAAVPRPEPAAAVHVHTALPHTRAAPAVLGASSPNPRRATAVELPAAQGGHAPVRLAPDAARRGPLPLHAQDGGAVQGAQPIRAPARLSRPRAAERLPHPVDARSTRRAAARARVARVAARTRGACVSARVRAWPAARVRARRRVARGGRARSARGGSDASARDSLGEGSRRAPGRPDDALALGGAALCVRCGPSARDSRESRPLEGVRRRQPRARVQPVRRADGPDWPPLLDVARAVEPSHALVAFVRAALRRTFPRPLEMDRRRVARGHRRRRGRRSGPGSGRRGRA